MMIKEFIAYNSLKIMDTDIIEIESIPIEKTKQNLFEELKRTTLFANTLPHPILRFKSGEVIFEKGNPPLGLYLVLEGKIKISKFGVNNRELIVRLSKAGDITGYVSFFSNENNSCTATAISAVKVTFLSKEVVQKALHKNDHLYHSVMQFLAKEIRRAEDKIVVVAQKPVKERIIEAIIRLYKKYGFENDGNTLAVSLSRTEIAGIAGTVRETVSRTLSDLCEQHLIEIEGKKIRVLDLQSLVGEVRV